MGISRKFGALLLTGALLAAASQASAATVTFNFGGGNGQNLGSSEAFTQNGVTVTVTGGALALNKEFNMVSTIYRWDEGLGLQTDYNYCSNGATSCSGGTKKSMTDSNHAVDDGYDTYNSGGHGVREFLKLDFGALNVSITNIDFGYHDSYDDAVVNINNNGTQIYAGGADPITAFNPYSPTSIFWIMAGGDNERNNDWKLKSVTISYNDTPGGPGRQEDVPVPAALSLMGLGLAGLGFVRRRKS